MHLRTFTLTLDAFSPAHAGGDELRRTLAAKFAEYAALHREDAATFIHRYPVVQYKMIDRIPTVIGINEGADFLHQLSEGADAIPVGTGTCRITWHGTGVKEEAFGISDQPRSYEFATPWLGLNQENYRKFFKLTGKPERDAFMRKQLESSIITMTKTLNYAVPGPVRCGVNLHFTKERLDGVSVMSFTGKFQVNFLIPDGLGIGRSVGRGFGAVQQLPAAMPDIPK
jgi:hypothetical protein